MVSHARLIAAFLATAGLMAPAALAGPGSPASCAALSDLKLDTVTVTAAEHVAPGWKPPKSLFGNPAAATSFCRVALTIEKEIRAEVWMPDIWNRRFEGVGNAGMTGDLNYSDMATAVRAGFAAATTDTGHKSPKGFGDAEWVAGHPDRLENFAHRAHHLMAVNAKKIIAAYYGTPADKNYYNGCSAGGWQGMTEAQRYPDDYDGIVAGAPAFDVVRFQTNEFLQARLSRLDPKGDIPAQKRPMIAKAMVAACDGADGLKDGIVSDPRLCKFDPRALQCKAGDGPDCLTKSQVARAKALYGSQATRKGLTLYPGLALGTALQEPTPGSDPFATTLIIQALKQKPAWRTDSFDPDRDIAPLYKELGWLNSDNPDLSAFKAHGGKLLIYHGWADNVLSPYTTLDYVHATEQRMPGAREFLRLFMIPTMGHCGGGDGPNNFDSNSAIVNWVENGAAPDELVGFHENRDGTTGMTRLLCAEPKVAVYKGTGSTDAAANFMCRKAK